MTPSPSDQATIIVPSYDRPEQLRTCLVHLAAQTGGPWHVIVVDDGSPRPLAQVCAAAGHHVRYIRRENGGPGAARNTGVAAAEGARWVLFTDDDCRPRPDWAMRLIAAQGGLAGRLVGGRIENALTANPYASASQRLANRLTEHYTARGSDMAFFTTNNMCCLRQDFLNTGGFDAAFRQASEDRDLSLRWKDGGGQLVHAHDAVVDHAHALDLRSFWRQHMAYGRGARQLHQRMYRTGDQRVRFERLPFYAGLLAWTRPTETLLIALSQIATATGYAQAQLSERLQRRSGRT